MRENEIEEHLLGVMLAHQYTLKKGIELFGLGFILLLKQTHTEAPK